MGTRARLTATALALALLGGCAPGPAEDPRAWRPTPQERRDLASACERDRAIYQGRLRALQARPWSQYAEEQYVEWRRLEEQTVLRCRALAVAVAR